jgi:hypothetical protein
MLSAGAAPRLRLAMYKGPAESLVHTVGHIAVRLRTLSRYSHCELVLGATDATGHATCWSSSGRDGGVRQKRLQIVSGRWDVYELPGYGEFDEAFARQWFKDRDGLPYDHLALLWFVLPINQFNRSKRFFCSEAVAAALRMRHPHKHHPQRLLDAAMKA